MTQAQVAQRLGVNRVTVSNWERGYSVPDEERIGQLAGLYGKSASQLRYGQHWGAIVEGMMADYLRNAEYERAPAMVSAWVKEALPKLAAYPEVDDATLPQIGAYLLAPAVWLFYGGPPLRSALARDATNEELLEPLLTALEKAVRSVRRELAARRAAEIAGGSSGE